ncbi:MAG: 3-deoxy-D-manno-octulosonic-acid transferase [Kiritimatiellia bacterium]|jgi:3-deoxy-D-manno-octulosonic-acid transferase
MIWWIYNTLFTVVYLALLPHFFIRMKRRGGYWTHFVQRFGKYNEQDLARFKETRRIWVHAVSVGEVGIALKFIETWRRQHPEERFVLSITTSTGNQIARDTLDDRDVVIYFPVDTPLVIRKVVRIINPKAYFMVESEFWPNLIRRLSKQQVPIALINGRISDRSFPRYMKLRAFSRRLMCLFNAFCVQSPLDRERVIALGAPPDRVHVLQSAKYEVAVRNPVGEADARAVLDQLGITPGTPLLMGGSTWPGEDRILAECYQRLKPDYPSLRLLLVPRHFEKADGVAANLDALGLSYLRKTQLDATSAPQDILILDTTGEMSNYYAHADLIFIGKSLCDRGGQNIIEPALYGKPILVGPNMQNFAQIMRDMLEAKAIVQVADADGLRTEVEALLADPTRREAIGAQAAALVQRNAGALTRTVDLLWDVVEG